MDAKVDYRRETKIEIDSSKDIYIPSCIFSKELSSLETIVKYLREVHGLSNQNIADLLSKKKQSIWRAYKTATEKKKDSFFVENLLFLVRNFHKQDVCPFQFGFAQLESQFFISLFNGMPA